MITTKFHIQILLVKLALLVYDTLLTLSREIKLIWRGKLRLAALLYFMTRYGAFLFLLVYLFRAKANIIHWVCLVLHLAHDSLSNAAL
jgi:hypothetical protein